MDREKILETSRKENKQGDERDFAMRNKSYAISAGFGMLLCVVIAAIESIVFERTAASVWTIYLGMEFIAPLVGYITTKKKFLLFLSIFMGICFVFMAGLYIRECITR